jgi:hypothetical protein
MRTRRGESGDRPSNGSILSDRSLIGTVAGVLSICPSGEELTVRGNGVLSFELNSVDISSCQFDARRSEPPSAAEYAIDVGIGTPFAKLYLTSGTRVAFSRVPAV